LKIVTKVAQIVLPKSAKWLAPVCSLHERARTHTQTHTQTHTHTHTQTHTRNHTHTRGSKQFSESREPSKLTGQHLYEPMQSIPPCNQTGAEMPGSLRILRVPRKRREGGREGGKEGGREGGRKGGREGREGETEGGVGGGGGWRDSVRSLRQEPLHSRRAEQRPMPRVRRHANGGRTFPRGSENSIDGKMCVCPRSCQDARFGF